MFNQSAFGFFFVKVNEKSFGLHHFAGGMIDEVNPSCDAARIAFVVKEARESEYLDGYIWLTNVDGVTILAAIFDLFDYCEAKFFLFVNLQISVYKILRKAGS